MIDQSFDQPLLLIIRPQQTRCKFTKMSSFPALMHFKPQRDVIDVVKPPSDPAQALLKRFTSWEKRVDNLIDFFKDVQRFQKEQARQYAGLSALAAERFGDDEHFPQDGVNSIWAGLKEKTLEVSRFYDGLPESYNQLIVNDLKIKLADIRVFKNEIQRIRKREAVKVAKKHKRFLDSVNNLNSSINRIGRPAPGDDPFVENRSTSLKLPVLT
jgi:hypothetical protein